MYRISIEKKEKFLLCLVTGENSLENVIHYLNDIHKAMIDLQCTRVLIEENLTGPGLSLIKMYQVIHTATKTVFSLPHKIAYVDINPKHNHVSLKFAETVALNRLIQMKLCIDINEAERWLQQD